MKLQDSQPILNSLKTDVVSITRYVPLTVMLQSRVWWSYWWH